MRVPTPPLPPPIPPGPEPPPRGAWWWVGKAVDVLIVLILVAFVVGLLLAGLLEGEGF